MKRRCTWWRWPRSSRAKTRSSSPTSAAATTNSFTESRIMPSISKFLFENSFDGPNKGAAPAKPVRRNFTAAELEAEKAKAFADGHKTGVTETANDAATRATVAFEKIAAHLGAVLGQMEAHRVESNRIAVTTAIAIMKKLLPALAQRQAAAEIETMI